MKNTSCTIITPVGPGHETLVENAARSVNLAAQIPGDFDRFIMDTRDDTGPNPIGRSKQRNAAIKEADTEWLFFLDADDLMYSDDKKSAFSIASRLLRKKELDAVFGLIVELENGQCYSRTRQPTSIKRYHQFLHIPPYLSVQMGHFVRRSVFDEMPAFNEDMDSGEDFEYFIRLWKNYRCIKIGEPLMLNVRGQHSTGPRAATGYDWNVTTARLMRAAQAEYKAGVRK